MQPATARMVAASKRRPPRLLIVTTPPAPSSRPAILRGVSLSFIQRAAKIALNIGDSELKIASMAAGSTSAAAE